MIVKFVVVDCKIGPINNVLSEYDSYEEAFQEIVRLLDIKDYMGPQEYKIEKRWKSS